LSDTDDGRQCCVGFCHGFLSDFYEFLLYGLLSLTKLATSSGKF
jgi:hypothetical protein